MTNLDNKKLEVSIIIPNYNGYELLEKILPLVINTKKYKKNNIGEIVVVDDASTDKSVEFLRNLKEIKLIKHKINRGFAASVNTGVRSVKSELVCLINSDVIPENNFLEKTLKHFEDDKVFGVSLHEEGYGYAAGKFENGFIIHKSLRASKDSKETFWVSGGSGIFRRSIWMKLGGFNEKLFKFYWEDIDLSYRALKRDYVLLWEPEAKVFHRHETTTSKTFSKKKLRRMQEVNQLVFIWKNLTSLNLFRKHITGLTKKITLHPGYIRIVLTALMKIRPILRARRKEKKEAMVSDEAIFARFLK